MCGISGKIELDARGAVGRPLLERMNAALSYRGPDDSGYYLHGHVGLAHCRLSIIGIESGKQPISNETGMVWVVFNGEIYNFRELRAGLVERGHVFRTDTDTEVLVHLYEDLGPDFVTRLFGMFSIALYDETEDLLLLARDRVGIKPLYYARTPRSVVFASEIKAILADPDVPAKVCRRAIDRFLTYYYLPGEETLFDGVVKLEPGHTLTVRRGKLEVRSYWDLSIRDAARVPIDTAIERLDALLADVVRGHMIADVPVGCLLSGGMDSTAVLSLAIEQSPYRLRTFTVGFDGEGFPDERRYAQLAAERFGTEHYETTISAQQFVDFLPRYVWHMEEPVCEPPAIALYYVSQLARRHVKVVISGEGGDEAFAGYSNYRNLCWLERAKRTLGPARALLPPLLRVLERAGVVAENRRYSRLAAVPLASYYYSRTASPFTYFNRSFGRLYRRSFAGEVSKEWSAQPTARALSRVAGRTPLSQMLYTDLKSWLPDDLLVKADKITMANSLELRVPLLDHRVLEFAASLPDDYKLSGATTKYILKKCFSGRVPREIVERKKAGFPVPYERWFREQHGEFVRDLLLEPRARARGYFEPDEVARLVAETRTSGRWARELFCLVVLELWHRIFLEGEIPGGATARGQVSSSQGRPE